MTGEEANKVTLLLFLARRLKDNSDFKVACHLIAKDWFGGDDDDGAEAPVEVPVTEEDSSAPQLLRLVA